jgi:hypothetical protein
MCAADIAAVDIGDADRTPNLLSSLTPDIIDQLLAIFLDTHSLMCVRQLSTEWKRRIDHHAGAGIVGLRFGQNTPLPPPLHFYKVGSDEDFVTPRVLPPWPKWGHRLCRDAGGSVAVRQRSDIALEVPPRGLLRALCWTSSVIEQLEKLNSVTNSHLLFCSSCGLAPLCCELSQLEPRGSAALWETLWHVAQCVLELRPGACMDHQPKDIDDQFWAEHLRPRGAGPRVDKPADALVRLFRSLDSPVAMVVNNQNGTLQCMPLLCIGLLPGSSMIVGFVAGSTP